MNFNIEKREYLNLHTFNSIEINTVNILLVYFMKIYDGGVCIFKTNTI